LEDYNGATQRIESWFDRPEGEAILPALSYPHALWLKSSVISPKALRFDAGSERTTQRSQQLRETSQRLAMRVGEYRVQFVFVGFGKHFIHQSQFMKENDILVPDVRICLSDPSHFAENMPNLLKVGEIELFVISSTQSSVCGLVIDHRLGLASRIGTWEAYAPCAIVFSGFEKLRRSSINSDWIIERKIPLT
jgi:hypothetical protein